MKLRLRYYFEHVLLPKIFFENSAKLYEDLKYGDKNTFIQKVLHNASRSGFDIEFNLIGFDIRTVEPSSTVNAIVLKMWKPEQAPDCFEIVLLFDGSHNPLRCITLESDPSGPNVCFVCEWERGRQHSILGGYDSIYNPGIVDSILEPYSKEPEVIGISDDSIKAAMSTLEEHQLSRFFPNGFSQAKAAIEYMNTFFECSDYKQALDLIMFYVVRIHMMGWPEERMALSAASRYSFISKDINSDLYFFFKNTYLNCGEDQLEDESLYGEDEPVCEAETVDEKVIEDNQVSETPNVENGDVIVYEKEVRFCYHCGYMVLEDACFCEKCGTRIR